MTLRNTGIFINEDLDNETMSLFYKARQLRNKGMILLAWTNDLKVHIRAKARNEPIIIGNEEDLTKFDQGQISDSLEVTLKLAQKLRSAGTLHSVCIEDNAVIIQSTKESEPKSFKDKVDLVCHIENWQRIHLRPRRTSSSSHTLIDEHSYLGFEDKDSITPMKQDRSRGTHKLLLSTSNSYI